MKYIVFICLFLNNLLYAQSDSQLLNKKTLMGELRNEMISIVIDKETVIDEINVIFFKNEKVIDHFEINTDYTLGDKHVKYYFLHFWSSEKNINIVRWLFLKDGQLFIDNSTDSEVYTYQDLYISCEGVDWCVPRLFMVGSEYTWTCREQPVCEFDENDSNKCVQTNTGL